MVFFLNYSFTLQRTERIWACDINMNVYSIPNRKQYGHFVKWKQLLQKPLEAVSACSPSEINQGKSSACQSAHIARVYATNTLLSLKSAMQSVYIIYFSEISSKFYKDTHTQNIFSGTQATISSEYLWVCRTGVWALCGSLSQFHRWEKVSTGAINTTGATSNEGEDRARDLPNHSLTHSLTHSHTNV